MITTPTFRPSTLTVEKNIVGNPTLVSVENINTELYLAKSQIQAQSDRSDFIEDCIAEMAMQVYGDG